MINSEIVIETLHKCFFLPEELPLENPTGWARENGVVVHGIVHIFAFHKGRLEESRPVIMEMISNLDKTFDDGWSFLNMCVDKEGKQWTGEQSVAEALACLGEAVGVFKCLTKRNMWCVLPGGMPYYQRCMKGIDK
jgi:hypothetical protein